MKLKIKKFSIDTMKQDRTILIVGKRGTGKSTLLKDVMYHLRKKVDIAFAMTPTLDTIRMFEECIPRSLIYNDYSLEMVQNILSNLKALEHQQKVRHAMLCLDDTMYDKSVLKSKEMREIHMNGRHFHLTFINCVQYVMDLGPEMRSQIDYVFALKENIISNRQKLHKYFFGMFEKFSEFALVMDKTTANYECLVLDNTRPGTSIEENIYYYKGNPNIGRFRIGRSIFYKLDSYYYKDDKDQRIRQQVIHQTGRIPAAKLPDPVEIKQKIETVEKE